MLPILTKRWIPLVLLLLIPDRGALGARSGGWAYLSDEDVRDGEILARFRRRHLTGTSAAELFQSLVEESAKASVLGAPKRDQQTTSLESIVPSADSTGNRNRKGKKDEKGSPQNDADSDDDNTISSPQAGATRTTPSPVPRMAPIVKGKKNDGKAEKDDDDDTTAADPQGPTAGPGPSSPVAPSVPMSRKTSPPVVKGSPGKKIKDQDDDSDDDNDFSVDDDDSTANDNDNTSTTTKPASSPTKKGSRVNNKSEKKKEKSRDACQGFEFVIDRRYRRGLQFDGAGCSQNVLELASQISDFSNFVELLEAADLDFIFDCGGPFTLLIPTNAALRALDDLNSLTVDEILNHVLPGVFLQGDFGAGAIEALNGGSVDVSVNPLRFNDAARVTSADNIACNGVLHGIDSVLVDLVVDVPGTCSEFVFDSNGAGQDCSPGLLDIARLNPSLNLAVFLIMQSGLADILACAGSFTVLMPTNTAFLNLGIDALKQLQDPNDTEIVRELFLYHIIPGRAASDTIQAGPISTLLDGEELVVSLKPLMFDSALVKSRDNPFCNGIYHIIDDVLIPSNRLSPSVPTALPTGQPISQIIQNNCDPYDFGGSNAGCHPNVLEQAKSNSDLSLAFSLFEVSGLIDIFDCAGEFTLLLPINDAIIALGQDVIGELLLPQSEEKLRDLLLFHILSGKTVAADFVSGPRETLATDLSDVSVTLDPIEFDGVGVVTPDLIGCNGVVHSIQAVLNPFLTSSPSVAPLVRVVVDRFYISYRSTSAGVPTANQYAANRLATKDYYETLCTDTYTNCRGIDFDLDFTLSGSDVLEPAERFNIYMEFRQAVFLFDNNANVPQTEEMYQFLQEGITTDYLMNVVRTQTGTPFAAVVEGFLKYVL